MTCGEGKRRVATSGTNPRASPESLDAATRGVAGPEPGLTEAPGGAPSRRARLRAALLLGLGAALVATVAAERPNPSYDMYSDFDQLWVAARALLSRTDPYGVIGPGSAVRWPWPLVYPATSAAAVLPVAVLPLGLARALVVGAGVCVLAWSLTPSAWWPLTLLASAPAIDAIVAAQWSPWLTAVALSSGVAWLAAIKPLGVTLSLATLDLRSIVRAATGGALMFLAATWLVPGWWNGFLEVARGVTHVRVLAARPLGLLCLLAVLRWRRPEARVMLAVLLAPLTPVLYDTLPLLLVARTRREAAAFVLLSLGALVSLVLLVPGAPIEIRPDRAADLILAWLFLPALALLWRRPNERDHPLFVR